MVKTTRSNCLLCILRRRGLRGIIPSMIIARNTVEHIRVILHVLRVAGSSESWRDQWPNEPMVRGTDFGHQLRFALESLTSQRKRISSANEHVNALSKRLASVRSQVSLKTPLYRNNTSRIPTVSCRNTKYGTPGKVIIQGTCRRRAARRKRVVASFTRAGCYITR